MATKTVSVKVSADGLAEVLKLAERLNNTLDKAEKPRKIRAASAALSASEPTPTTGLTRGTAGSQTRGDSRDFSRQAQGLGGLVHLYATFAANIFAVSAAFTALSKAADFTNMEKAADILSTKVGTSIRGVAKDMKTLTDGAISMTDALGSASLASSAGLSSKQIKELTTVAKGAAIALGRDMTDALQRVFRGTIKIEPELLDELGLMVKVDDANKAYAKTLGKTISTLTDYERRQAFVNAVTTQGINKYKELAEQAANPFSKLLSSVKDLGTSIMSTINVALGPFITLLSTSPTALLIGLGAIVALLLKQAVPAISNMRAAWVEQDAAAQKSITKQIKLIEERKKAIVASAAEELKTSKVALLKQTELLENSIKSSTLSGTKFGASIRGLLWSDDPAKIRQQEAEAVASAKSLAEKVQKELTNRKAKLKIDIGEPGSYKNLEQFEKSARYVEVLEKRLLDLKETSKLIATTASAAGQGTTAEAALHRHDEALQKLIKDEQKYQKLASNRGALAASYDKADMLGFGAGFGQLNDELEKVKGQNSTLTQSFLKVKGTMGLVTLTASKLLGTFSIWGAIAAISIPILGGLAKWMGLVGEKSEKLNSTTEALSNTMDTFVSVQEKLSSGHSLADLYDLQAASVNSLAESLKKAAEAKKEYDALVASGETLSKAGEGFSQIFGIGKYNEKEQLKSLKVYLEAVKEGLIAADAVKITTKKAIGSGKFAEENLTAESYAKATGTEQTNAILDSNTAKSKIDPKAIKELEAFNSASIATKNNLKELSDISSEYSRGLVNQSKDLKAVSALGSSTVGTLTMISKKSKEAAPTIANFLNNITSEFEQLSNTPLSSNLTRLRTELAAVDSNIVDFESTIRALGPAAGETADAFNNRVKKEVSAKLTKDRADVVDRAGGKSAVATELSQYTITASKALADFSLATSRATLAQAVISKKLKTLSVYTSLGGTAGSGVQARAEQKAARDKANIEASTIRTNQKSIEKQIEVQEKALAGYVKVAEQAGYSNFASPNDAAEAIIKSTVDSLQSIKPGVVSVVTSLISLKAQAEGLSNTLKTLYMGLDSKEGTALLNQINSLAVSKESKTYDASINLQKSQNINLEKYGKAEAIGVSGASELRSYNDEKSQALSTVAKELATIAEKEGLLLGNKENPGLLTKRDDLNAKGKLITSDEASTLEAVKNAITEANRVIESSRLNIQAENIRSENNNLAEDTRKKNVGSAQLSTAAGISSTQVDLYAQIADFTLKTTENYYKLNELNKLQSTSLGQQLSLEKQILDNVIQIENEKIKAATADNKQGVIEAEQAIMKAKQAFQTSQLKAVTELTEMYKTQHELSLKIMEESGNWKELFTGEGLQEAATIMANRIEETMGKAKSSMSQLATGLVDAADLITDNFTTMLQKMDETKVTWVAFRDMVRNTLSDMFRNMASDVLKNQIKKMMLSTLKYFDLDTKTDAEKAANKLGLNTDLMVLSLDSINRNIDSLVTSSYRNTPEYKEKQNQNKSNEILAVEEMRQQKMLEGKYKGYSNIDRGFNTLPEDWVPPGEPKGKVYPNEIPTKGSSIPNPAESYSLASSSKVQEIAITSMFPKLENIDVKELWTKYLPQDNWDELNQESLLLADMIKNYRLRLGTVDAMPIENFNFDDQPAFQQSIDSKPNYSFSKAGMDLKIPESLTISSDNTASSLNILERSASNLGDSINIVARGLDSDIADKIKADTPQYLEPVSYNFDKSATLDYKSAKINKDSAQTTEDASYKFDTSATTSILASNTMLQAAQSMINGGSASDVGKDILMTVAKKVIGYAVGPSAAGTTAPIIDKSISANAKGGIVGPLGDLPLNKFAKGGIASSPQMALFGEGSKNEAFVPLPDNRSIPVTLNGSQGGSMGDVNISISINNSGKGSADTTIDVEQSKKFSTSLAASIKATIQEELMKQMKPRGLLYAG